MYHQQQQQLRIRVLVTIALSTLSVLMAIITVPLLMTITVQRHSRLTESIHRCTVGLFAITDCFIYYQIKNTHLLSQLIYATSSSSIDDDESMTRIRRSPPQMKTRRLWQLWEEFVSNHPEGMWIFL
jgi:uncharacterized membrane protein YqjE